MIEIDKLSPAARLALLKETVNEHAGQITQWRLFDDQELLRIIGRMSDEFAYEGPETSGWYFAWILDQLGVRLARPYSTKCRCGKDVKVNQ